jgi:hypothetical protein
VPAIAAIVAPPLAVAIADDRGACIHAS